MLCEGNGECVRIGEREGCFDVSCGEGQPAINFDKNEGKLFDSGQNLAALRKALLTFDYVKDFAQVYYRHPNLSSFFPGLLEQGLDAGCTRLIFQISE